MGPQNEDRPGRYGGLGKFITDPDKLELDQHALVYISAEEDYDIAVDLEGQEEKFDALRPYIAFVETKKHIPGSPEISRFFRVCVANVLQFNP